MGILWIGLLSADAFMRGGYRTVQECAVVSSEIVNVFANLCDVMQLYPPSFSLPFMLFLPCVSLYCGHHPCLCGFSFD